MNRQSLPSLLLNNESFASGFPFIALFPCSTCHAPKDQHERGWTTGNFARVDRLLEMVLKGHRGDPTRVSLTGQSMGGGGLYRYALARRAAPQFAALVPVCAAMRPPPTTTGHGADLCCSNAAAAAQGGCCPNVWAFHGANDGSVPVSFTDKWVEALKAQGKQEVRYTRYEWACAAGAADRAWVVSAQYTDAALLAPPLRRPPPPMPEYSQMTGHASYEYAYREPELWSWLLQQRCAACAGPPRHAGTSSAEHVGSVSKLNQLNAALGT